MSGLLVGATVANSRCSAVSNGLKRKLPLVISTWDAGIAANEAAWQVLKASHALDAVEQGVMVAEADPSNSSVGFGGLPDRDGHTTLDASIMDWQGNAGSVSFLEHIKHPISVARRVMEKTPHVMLSGEGALQFALSEGFQKEDISTPKSRAEWEKWKVTSDYKPVINIENHDTIGMLAIDTQGHIAGACTTSGLAFKMRGRVGDSPIIGAGLYVDNEIGGAVSTGLGEVVLRNVSTFLIVELMRGGLSPQAACEEAIRRIAKREKKTKDIQVCFLAVNMDGEIGAYALQPGFSFAVYREGTNQLINSQSHYSK